MATESNFSPGHGTVVDVKIPTLVELHEVKFPGGRATPGEFDIFRFSSVNFPTLGSSLRVKSLPLGITDLE